MNILVKSTNWVGDAVMQTPALHALRCGFPEARLTLVARDWVALLFADHPDVDEVLIEPKSKPHRRDFQRTLKRRPWDLGISLPNSFSAAALLWRAGAKRRIGYARDARRFLLTDPVRLEPWLRHGHEVDHYLHLVGGVVETEGIDRQPRIGLSPNVAGATQLILRHLMAEKGIGGDPPLVAIGAGAAFGTAKRWLPERFAECARALRDRHGVVPVLTGSWKESGTTAQIAQMIGEPVLDLAGKMTLDQLAALLGEVRLFLTNDSGPMHIAAALGTPTVAVFGSTNWRTTAPLGPRVRLVREPVDCAPCLKRHCPIDHRCMAGVGVERVLAACEALLREPADAACARTPQA